MASATTLLITTSDPVQIRGLFIGHIEAPASGGACIDVSPPSGVNGASRFTDLMLHQCFQGLRTTRAAYWTMTMARITYPTSTGVWVQNDHNHDEGDSLISDSFFGLGAGAEGITWVSSGGLRVTNTKFLGGHTSINLSPAAGVTTTGIFMVTGSSIDWYEYAAIRIHTGPKTTFVLTSITGNEFGGYIGGTAAVEISGSEGLSYASTITGNTFNLTCLKQCAGTRHHGVLLSAGAQAIVTSNVFGGVSPAGSAIQVAQTFHEAVIGENSFSPAIGVSISNASASTRLKTNHPLKWSVIQKWLGSPRGGSEVWCDDCRGASDAPYQSGSACAASGAGAVARRVGTAWRCW